MRFGRFLLASKMWFTAALFFFFAVTFWAQEEVSHTGQASRDELRGALLQARDAVVRLAAEDPSSLDTSISEKVAELVESLRYIDDREDIRYLQQHLTKVYADPIQSALAPTLTVNQLPNLLREAEREKDSVTRDQKLGVVVEQQIKHGLLEDAAINAAKINTPTSRATLFTSIAVAQHKASNDAAAENSLDAAIKACLEPPPNMYVFSADMQLENLATSLAQQGYGVGARTVLASARKAITSKKRPNGYDWYHFADAAIDIGDLDDAMAILPKVEAGELRTTEAERMIAAQARTADPGNGVTLAMRIQVPDRRASVLCDIARKQASSGEGSAAVATIEVALEAAAQSDEYRVFTLNDIAWAQIDIDD